MSGNRNRYSEMERILKDQGERGLEHMEFYFGLDFEVHRQIKHDAYSQVHGRDAGGPTSMVETIHGVLEGDDFLPSNNWYSGNFETGFLYTRSEAILIGDTIKIVSSDGKSRQFKIVERQQIGFTTEIFTKWKLSALGD